MRRIAALITTMFFMVSGLYSQIDSDSIELSSFRKGRNLVGLNGSISSTNLSRANGSRDNSQLGNLYRFDIRLGKFVANKNALGLVFSASRTQMIGYINNKAEFLNVGPWYRIYLGKEANIAFYIQTDLLYSNYYGSSTGLQSLRSIDEEIDVAGIQGALGIGLSYVMGDRVSFDVGFEYNQSRYWGIVRDNTLGTEEDLVIDRDGIIFSFGFQVFFKRLKKDE